MWFNGLTIQYHPRRGAMSSLPEDQCARAESSARAEIEAVRAASRHRRRAVVQVTGEPLGAGAQRRQ